MREALDGDDLDARSGDGHNRAAGKEGAPSTTGHPQPKNPTPIDPCREIVGLTSGGVQHSCIQQEIRKPPRVSGYHVPFCRLRSAKMPIASFW
ncbi:hypothetical protein GCM10028793_64410 [Nocardiopsis oceani]